LLPGALLYTDSLALPGLEESVKESRAYSRSIRTATKKAQLGNELSFVFG
jgi:hypothetical protein